MTKKIEPTDDEQIYAHVDQWLTDSLSFNTTELSHQRAEALKYYFGEPFGNEKRGKSQVVTRDIAETIDSIMPSLMKVFHSGGQVVKYNPDTADDVESINVSGSTLLIHSIERMTDSRLCTIGSKMLL